MVSFTVVSRGLAKSCRYSPLTLREPLKRFDQVSSKKFQTLYSSISEKHCIDSHGNRSLTVLDPSFLKDSDRLLLANSRFFCQEKPLLGVNRDGTLNHWSLLPPLSVDQFDPKSAFEAKPKEKVLSEEPESINSLESEDLSSEVSFQYLSPNNQILEGESSAFFHPLITRFDGDAAQTANTFLDSVLEKLASTPRRNSSRISLRRNRTRSNRPVYHATSVLRKRRAKMNKHKYKKFRKRTRALRKRLNK